MSFSIYLTNFTKGENTKISRAVFDQVLGPFVQPGVGYGPPRLVFPDGGGGEYGDEEGEEINGIYVNRPGGLDLYRALFNILSRTPTALYWSPGIVVADPAVIPDLPPDMIEAWGEPKVVKSGEEILAAILAS
jgi:hypothetical protein